MSHFKSTITSLVIPIIVMLGIGLVASIVAPVFWTVLNGAYPLEKIYQKTGLLLLVISAIYGLRTPVVQTQEKIQKSSLTNQLKRLTYSWLLGVLILAFPLFILLALKIRIPDTTLLALPISILLKFISALAIGLVVAVVEEYIFRGWLLGWLQTRLGEMKTIGQILAILISALYFALLHFVKPAVNSTNQHNTFLAGLDVFLRSLQHLYQHSDADTLIALFLAGILLAQIKIRFNHGLIVVIGIHAGWVFCIKITKALTDSNPASQLQYLVGHNGIVGYLSAGWLGILVLGLIVFGRVINKQHKKASRNK
ncbi:MAG: CPBP family intramembrane glutamic endopeptidase [Methylococcales bacterium]